MESPDDEESDGEKSASGKDMQKSASVKDLESPGDEESDVAEHIELEAKEPMPPVQKKVGRSRNAGPKFARVQVYL